MSKLIVIPFTRKSKHVRTIDITYMDDTSLSWREKGILSYLLTRPKKWKFRINDLYNRSTDGKDSNYNAIKGLSRSKYIHRFMKYKDGRIAQWTYIVFSKPTILDKKNLKKLVSDIQEQGHLVRDILDQVNHDAYIDKEYIYVRRSKDHSDGGISSSKIKEKEKKKKPLPSKQKKELDQRTLTYIKPATKLLKIIQSTRHVELTPSKLKAWANDLRKLHETDKIPKTRIKEAIKWYEEHIGGKYIPIIHCGQTFRSKFMKLEDAMQRAGDLEHEEMESQSKRKLRSRAKD